MEPTADDMLTIEPRPCSSIAGRKARQVRCIDLTLMSNDRSQSCSEHCRIGPSCTQPAQLTRICGAPKSRTTDWASASTSGVERTSSLTLFFAASPLSLAASRSLAITTAPSPMKRAAIARPMPWPAAVMTATLSFNRAAMGGDSWKLARCLRSLSPQARGEGEERKSMVVPRHALLGDVAIFDGGREHHALGELLD